MSKKKSKIPSFLQNIINEQAGIDNFDSLKTSNTSTSQSNEPVNTVNTISIKVEPEIVEDNGIGILSNLDTKFLEEFIISLKKLNLTNESKKDVLDLLLYYYLKDTSIILNEVIMKTLFGDNGFSVDTLKYTSLIGLLNKYVYSINDYQEEGKVSFDALCKVFEMFIPTDDAEDGDIKKDTGSVYTPKDLAYYMSVDSLVGYLKGRQLPLALDDDFYHALASNPLSIDKAIFTGKEKEAIETLNTIDSILENIKILEPSIGAGAFAHSMLVVLTNIRKGISNLLIDLGELIATEDYCIKYDTDLLKKHILLNNLYGTDINKDAIEMTRKRLWISYLSEYKSFENVTLPNIELNIIVGNSVLDRGNNKRLVVKDFNFNGAEFIDFNSAKRTFKEVDYYDKSIALHKVFEEFKKVILSQDLLLDFTIKEEIGNTKNYNDLEEVFKKYFSYSLMFSELVRLEPDSTFQMKEVLFDIVIGNPPYVRASKFPSIKKDIESKYETYHGSADLLIYFYEQGFNLLKENGVLSFITSNKWLTAKYGEKLRSFLKEHTELLLLVDFKGNRVFKGVGVDTEITVFRKSKPKFNTLIYCAGENYKVLD